MVERMLFINPTKTCNVDCLRCFMSTESRLNKDDGIPMEFIEQVVTHPFYADHPNVEINWTGGEPTLLGEKKLRGYLEKTRAMIPHARHSMVSNLFSMKPWIADLCHEFMNSKMDTTFAFGDKANWDQSEDVYLRNFEAGLKQAIELGVDVAVNVETNKKTIDMGLEAIIGMAERTGCKNWQFDLSVDFDDFRRNPVFNEYGYPVLQSPSTHKEMTEFLTGIFTDYRADFEKAGIQTNLLMASKLSREDSFFNIMRSNEMITLSPEGHVTMDPLLIEVSECHLGNLHLQTFDECLKSPIRKKHYRHELARARSCMQCEYFSMCLGGSSHVALHDGSGECAGFKGLWKYRLKNEQGVL